MPTITINDYLELAEEAYAPLATQPAPLGWNTQQWEWGTWYGNGFQGGIFSRADEVVVAFSGTKGGACSAPISQNSANLRIGLHVIPNMAGSANTMVQWAKDNAGTRRVSIVGHSLGGSLAQVVGYWQQVPFISFNGPGMLSHVRISGYNILAPMQMSRTRGVAAEPSAAVGICFNVEGDPLVEIASIHLGRVVKLKAPSVDTRDKHGWLGLRSGLGRNAEKTPHDFNPAWPLPTVALGPVAITARRGVARPTA